MDATTSPRNGRPRVAAAAKATTAARPRAAATLALLASSLGVAWVPTDAHAGGIETAVVGAVAMGRAGAFTTRASDPTALAHNVAGLAGLPGIQVTLSSNLGLLSHCFERAGNYDGEAHGVATDDTVFSASRYAAAGTAVAYPRVCNEGGPLPVPALLATWRIHPRFAVGAGVYAPAGVGSQRFADRVNTPAGLAPSPTRYLGLGTDILVIHPTIAVATAPFAWLRLGAALQPSVARFAGSTMANAFSGQSPTNDIRSAADAWGFFWAGNLGLQVLPTPFLSFGLHVHLNQTPVVLRGRTTTQFNYYASDSSRTITSSFDSVVNLPLPSQARLGVRFALPRTGLTATLSPGDPARPLSDPMRDEVFDVELVGTFESSSVLDNVVTENTGTIDLGDGRRAPVVNATLRRSWRDIWGVRLGGDANILPGVLALRGGVAYEMGAQTGPRLWQGRRVEYNPDASIDTVAYDSVTLALGASLRLWRWLEIDAAFAHVVMLGQTVPNGRATLVGGLAPVTDEACSRPSGPPGPGACNNNQGTFSAAFTVFSLGVTGRW